MKKVLIISYYWPPSGGSGVQRWVKFSKYLPSEGWQPIIYTPENPELTAVDRNMEKDVPREAIILKTKILEPYGLYRIFTGGKKKGPDGQAPKSEVNPINGGPKTLTQKISLFIRGNFFIPDARCLWIRPSVRFLKKYLKEHPVDLIVSTGPPHSMHVIAQRVSKATGLPWIADFRDPWTKIFYFKHLPLMPWARRRHSAMEKSVLDNASAVVTVSPPLKPEFEAMTSTPVHCITNGYDETDFQQIVEADGYFNITHTGLFAESGNPLTFWKVLADKCREDEMFDKLLRIRLVGKTDQAIIQAIGQAGLQDHLKDLGYQPHHVATAEQMGASLLLLPQRQEPEFTTVITGKIFEYMASGHPVLGIGMTEGAMADLLAESKCGKMFAWDDYQGMKAFLDKSWKSFQTGNLSTKSENYTQYSRRALSTKMARLMNSLTK